MCLGAGRPQEGYDAVVLGHVSLEDYCKSNVARLAGCPSKSTFASRSDAADSKSEISTDSGNVCDVSQQGVGSLESGDDVGGRPAASEGDADSKSEISAGSGRVLHTEPGRPMGFRGTPQVHRLVSMYNELSQAREKHKQCISLLQSSASKREQPKEQSQAPSRQTSAESQPSLKGSESKVVSRQTSQASSESVPALHGSESKLVAGRRAALSEVQARHALCIKLAKDQKTPAPVLPSAVQDEAKEECCPKDLLPVLFAQIAVNHVTELAEMRKIKETQEALLLQHEALVSENAALQLRNEALMEELRTQAQHGQERLCADNHKHPVGKLGLLAAVVVAAGAAVAVARARS